MCNDGHAVPSSQGHAPFIDWHTEKYSDDAFIMHTQSEHGVLGSPRVLAVATIPAQLPKHLSHPVLLVVSSQQRDVTIIVSVMYRPYDTHDDGDDRCCDDG